MKKYQNKSIDQITSNILGAKGSYWIKNKNYIKYNFALRLFQYSAGKMLDYTAHLNTSILPSDPIERKKITDKYRSKRISSTRAKQFQRLLIGNYGVFETLTAKKCNLSSKKANELKLSGKSKNSDFVSDHIIGVTSIGEYVIKNFKAKYLKIKQDKDWVELDYPYILLSINKMCDDWLSNHLWLWAMCRLTKEEHDSGEDGIRVERGTNIKVDDKRKLKHYSDAGIIIEEYKSNRDKI